MVSEIAYVDTGNTVALGTFYRRSGIDGGIETTTISSSFFPEQLKL